MLGLPGFAELLRGRPVVGVSPVVNGRAVKGPLVEMFASLQQREASAAAVADWYGDLVSAWVVEQGDEAPLLRDGRLVHGCATVMGGLDGRCRLAREVLAFSARFVR
jgi:LPPG:FO 2-phospho-L-lactate transferase